MKTNKILYIAVSAMLTTLLFYKESWGINLLLFAGIIIGFQVLAKPGIIVEKSWLIFAGGSLLTALGFNLTNGHFAGILYFLSLCTLLYLHQKPDGFSPLALPFSIPNIIFSSTSFFKDILKKKEMEPIAASPDLSIEKEEISEPETEEENLTHPYERERQKFEQERQKMEVFENTIPENSTEGQKKMASQIVSMQGYGLLKRIIPVLLFMIFLTIYTLANSDFNQLILKIYSIVNLTIILFFSGSAILMISFLYGQKNANLEAFQNFIKETFSLKSDVNLIQEAKLKMKEKEATRSFWGLIFLLTILLVLEFKSIFLPDPKLNLSENLHSNINAVIFSIILAALVVMYYFSGRIFTIAHIQKIKNLAFTWIGLNVVLAWIGIYKTLHYINAYGLTYKRISTIEYLLTIITCLGLVWFAINLKKGNWWLTNRVITLTYSFLVIYNLPSWDRIMVRYNFTHVKEQDLSYYEKLSLSGFAEYLQLENPNLPYQDERLSNKLWKFKETYFYFDWQSKTFEDRRIYGEISQHLGEHFEKTKNLKQLINRERPRNNESNF